MLNRTTPITMRKRATHIPRFSILNTRIYVQVCIQILDTVLLIRFFPLKLCSILVILSKVLHGLVYYMDVQSIISFYFILFFLRFLFLIQKNSFKKYRRNSVNVQYIFRSKKNNRYSYNTILCHNELFISIFTSQFLVWNVLGIYTRILYYTVYYIILYTIQVHVYTINIIDRQY